MRSNTAAVLHVCALLLAVPEGRASWSKSRGKGGGYYKRGGGGAATGSAAPVEHDFDNRNKANELNVFNLALYVAGFPDSSCQPALLCCPSNLTLNVVGFTPFRMPACVACRLAGGGLETLSH